MFFLIKNKKYSIYIFKWKWIYIFLTTLCPSPHSLPPLSFHFHLHPLSKYRFLAIIPRNNCERNQRTLSANTTTDGLQSRRLMRNEGWIDGRRWILRPQTRGRYCVLLKTAARVPVYVRRRRLGEAARVQRWKKKLGFFLISYPWYHLALNEMKQCRRILLTFLSAHWFQYRWKFISL